VKLNSLGVCASILAAVAISMHSQSTTPPVALSAKIAVVSLQQAILSTQDGQQATAAIRTRFEPTRLGLEKRQTELQTISDQLRKGAAVMSAEAQQRLGDDFAAKKKTFDRDAEDLDAAVRKEEDRLMQDITGKLGAVIDEYARANGYTVVMDASQPVLWAAETANITPNIIERYDRKYSVAAVKK